MRGMDRMGMTAPQLRLGFSHPAFDLRPTTTRARPPPLSQTGSPSSPLPLQHLSSSHQKVGSTARSNQDGAELMRDLQQGSANMSTNVR